MRLPDINQLRPGNWNPLLCKQPSRGARFPQCRRCSCTLRVVGVGIIPWRPGCQGWVLGWRVLVGKKLCGKKGVHSIIQQKNHQFDTKKNIISWANEVQGPGNEILNGERQSLTTFGELQNYSIVFFSDLTNDKSSVQEKNKNNKLSPVTSQKWKIPHEKNAEHAVSNYGMRKPLLRPHVSLSKRSSNHGHQSNHKYNQFFLMDFQNLAEFKNLYHSLIIHDVLGITLYDRLKIG